MGVVDLLSRKPAGGLKARILKPNYASIMAQVVAVWAEQLGHRVQYVTYTGFEDLERVRPRDIDLLFICSFTQAAYLAYSLSNLYRKQGVTTVLGGPHARAYTQDARRFFDYVVGFANKQIIQDLLQDYSPNPSEGVVVGASEQPRELPGVRERWKYIRHNLDKTPRWFRAVSMVGSLGCPYQCGFCIDSRVPYQPLPFDQLREDLTFLAKTFRKPLVAWHDPNFGVRFDDYMSLIEEAAAPGTFRFVAESTLSQLTEPHLQQLQRNGFVTLIIGIESWFDYNLKARQASRQGMDKVKEVAEQANLVTRHIPYLQTNFMFGIDADAGRAPFELTRRFVDLAPAAIPAYSFWTSFGDSAALDCQLQEEGRVLKVPFHFLAHSSMNIIPRNYTYLELLDHVVDLTRYSFLPRVVMRRLASNSDSLLSMARWSQLIRSKGVLGKGRYVQFRKARDRLASDRELQAFYAGQSTRVPSFFRDKIRADLGPYYEHLPKGALDSLGQTAT
ncbi:B12-binding domain-containing radical SAM protein [Candidatus Latescibacterota bacterium]